jgi:hypothetical protein
MRKSLQSIALWIGIATMSAMSVGQEEVDYDYAEEPRRETKLANANKPLSALLDEGWIIHGFSSRDIDWKVEVTIESGSRPVDTVARPTRDKLEFILSKGTKWIYCHIRDTAAYRKFSYCYSLN